MFWIILQFVGAAFLGILAAEGGRAAYRRYTNTPARRELTIAVRYRAPLLAAIIGGVPVMMSAFGNDGEFSRTLSIVWFAVSFAMTLPYTAVWLHLATTWGSEQIESGELVLLLAVLPFAFLYVCGILWITLGILLVLAAVGAGGLYFYQARHRSGAS